MAPQPAGAALIETPIGETMNVIFENKGEIDPLLITTFGVNVKENDSPIGFFGTGLKYALAILMRHGCSVVIQSGHEHMTFGKKVVTVRGKGFEFVTMNSAPLGFTTEVGKQWDLWMAYREMYCNSQDEGGTVYESEAIPVPQQGVTRVIVSGDAFVEIARRHGEYFLTSDPWIKAARVNIHQGESRGCYYRNVMVGKLSARPTMFTYNVNSSVDLTEDRTLKHPFLVSHRIAAAVIESDNPAYIRACVTAADHYHESELDFDLAYKPSPTFMEVVGHLMKDRIASVNKSAVELYRKNAHAKLAPDIVTLNRVERAMLEKARSFCASLGFNINYEVCVVESLGMDILGMARDDTIYLAHRAFVTGTKCVAGTLIEEYVHLKHGYQDCTRGMQNYLLDKMVSLGELAVGEPL